MIRALIGPAVALLLAAAAAADDPPEPVSGEALWFRIAVGPEPVTTVLGFFDETRGTGKGYDVAVVDADGDGVPESRQHGEHAIIHPDESREVFQVPEIEFTHRGAEWQLLFSDIGEERPRPEKGVARTGADWFAVRGDDILMFGYGDLLLHPSAEAARRMPPTRIGPPFAWEAAPGQQGPAATVDPVLRDAGGFTLSNFWRGDEIEPVRLTLRRGDDVAAEARGEYG